MKRTNLKMFKLASLDFEKPNIFFCIFKTDFPAVTKPKILLFCNRPKVKQHFTPKSRYFFDIS